MNVRKKETQPYIGDASFSWMLTPSDIREDGQYNFQGVYRDLIGTELCPPDDDYHPVIAVSPASEIEGFNKCPHCRASVEPSRPVFACGSWSVLPCTDCNQWVWLATDITEGNE